MSWSQTVKRLRVALTEIDLAEEQRDITRPPSDSEREELAAVCLQLQERLEELARRIGISSTVPQRYAPDFNTALQRGTRKVGDAIDALGNRRDESVPNGSARGYVDNAITRLRQVRTDLSLAGVESTIPRV